MSFRNEQKRSLSFAYNDLAYLYFFFAKFAKRCWIQSDDAIIRYLSIVEICKFLSTLKSFADFVKSYSCTNNNKQTAIYDYFRTNQ